MDRRSRSDLDPDSIPVARLRAGWQRAVFCCLLWNLCLASAVAQTFVVQIPGGEAMFEKSGWLQTHLRQGAAGWSTHPLTFSNSIALNIPKTVDPAFAYGKRTDVSALRARVHKNFSKDAHLTLTWDEVLLAQRYQTYCTPEQGKKLEQKAWRAIDLMLDILMEAMPANSDLVIVSTPDPERHLTPSDQLMPVFLKGKRFGKGSLYDHKTGQVGWTPHLGEIIAQTRPPTPSANRQSKIAEVPTPNTLRLLKQSLLDQARRNDLKPLLIALATLSVIVGTLALFLHRPAPRKPAVSNIQLFAAPPRAAKPAESAPSPTKPKWRWMDWAQWLPLFACALWVSSLLPAAQTNVSVWGTILALLIGSSALLGFALWLRAPITGIGVAIGLGLILLALDLLTGSRWAMNGVLGYSLLEETRYAGMGTDYAALLLGGALLFLGCWLQIEGLPAVGYYLLSVIILLLTWRSHHPAAVLSACVSLGLYATFLPQKSLLMKRWLWLLAIPVGYAVWMILPDIQTLFTPTSVHLKAWLASVASLEGIALGALLGAIWLIRRRQFIDPLTLALERAWLGAALIALISGWEGIRLANGLLLLYWVYLAARYWQESPDLTEN